jgi:hypothetical protein
MSPRAPAIGAALVLVVAAVTYPRAQTVTQRALTDAAVYVSNLRARLPGVVLEERYLQQTTSRLGEGATRARELLSDVVLMDDERWGWVEFRDVFQVDGEPVRDRQDRIVGLFSQPGADAREQARDIVREGARYNLEVDGASFDRTLNLPLAALRFLQAENQRRSRFERGRTDTMFGRAVTVVTFREEEEPRLIGTPDGAAARGTFWIEQETGRVLRTELHLSTRRGNTTVSGALQVQFAAFPDLALWLPGSMEEDYILTDARERRLATVSGRASYTNARRFGVTVQEQVTAP